MATKVDFTLPDGNKYTWTAEGYLEELIKGLIRENQYTLPAASASQLGGVKTGSNITNTDGSISLTKKNVTDALGYTPPTTDTVYSHPNTTARTGKPTSNVTVQLGSAFTISQVSNDANGHVNAITDRTVTVNHPTTAGNKHIPSGGSSGQVLKWKADGEAQWANDTASTISGGVTGVKGSAESTYRDGNVNITAANVGAAASSHSHSPSDIGTMACTGTHLAGNLNEILQAGVYLVNLASSTNFPEDALEANVVYGTYVVLTSSKNTGISSQGLHLFTTNKNHLWFRGVMYNGSSLYSQHSTWIKLY